MAIVKILLSPLCGFSSANLPKQFQDNLKIMVHYTGRVQFLDKVEYEIRCFPYNNTLSCPIRIGPWTYDVDQVLISNPDMAVDLSEYSTDPNFEIYVVSTKVEVHQRKYNCCEKEISDITYIIKIRVEDKYNSGKKILTLNLCSFCFILHDCGLCKMLDIFITFCCRF